MRSSFNMRRTRKTLITLMTRTTCMHAPAEHMSEKHRLQPLFQTLELPCHSQSES